ncbi:hypothetical protein D8674_038198 [Pyrus ussuriensis x Pyrus communis]|uniref:Uncharacterized protein n=1 Tax=Pyrus ussuriensis x Pyrus communis TaxID=2448454 RepID=A0A5N5I4T8_9ROSA|nr:hypothetical protein D8674_038198 [Pyrus ussuriensis x Pyrus communis]
MVLPKISGFKLRVSRENNFYEAGVELEEETADALVLQEAAAEVARQKAGSSHVHEDVKNISKMFSESETEAGPEVETRALRWARSAVVESSNSKPERVSKAKPDSSAPRATPTKKITRSQTSQVS